MQALETGRMPKAKGQGHNGDRIENGSITKESMVPKVGLRLMS